MSKNITFSASIFKGFGLRFGRFFRWFFEENVELISNCEPKLQTLKIVIFLRENTYFQGNLESVNAKFISKVQEKSKVFGTFDIPCAVHRPPHQRGKK